MHTPARLPSVLPVALLLTLVPGMLVGDEPPILLTQGRPRDAGSLLPPSVPFTRGPVIPGLQQGAVPQGMAVAGQRIFLSHYFDEGPSCLSVLDASTGRLLASVVLRDAEGQAHRGHAGGIAVLGEFLFVASDGKCLQYALKPLLQEKLPRSVQPVATRRCETAASFCAATEELLLIGEFAKPLRYRTDPAHHLRDRKGVRKYAWICGYSAEDPLGRPTCVLSIRQRVQGICVSGDRVYLSISWGRRNRSTIAVYRNPLGGAPHSAVRLRDGSRVPLWFLDGENWLGEIDFPPMSEGIAMLGSRLAVLAESGAGKFQRGGTGPLDQILLLDVSGIE